MGDETSGATGFQPPRAEVPGLPDLAELLSIGRVELPELRPLGLPAVGDWTAMAAPHAASPHNIPRQDAAPQADPPHAASAPATGAAPSVAVGADRDLEEALAALRGGDVAGALDAIGASRGEVEQALAASRAHPGHVAGVVAQRIAQVAGDDPAARRVADRAQDIAQDPRIASAVAAVGARLDDAQRQQLGRIGAGLQSHAAQLLDGEITAADLRGAVDGVRRAARDGSGALSPALRAAYGEQTKQAARRGIGCFAVALALGVVVLMIAWGLASVA